MAYIFNTKQDGKYLYIDMHHIIGDGTSLVILLNDIEKVYKGIKLEKEKFTGFNYALEEQELLKTDKYEKAKTEDEPEKSQTLIEAKKRLEEWKIILKIVRDWFLLQK